MVTVGDAKRIVAQIDATLSDTAAFNERVDASFRNLDKDGSGHLDMAESRHLVIDLCGLMHLPPPTDEDFRVHFTWLDADQSGTLNREEVGRGVFGALGHKAAAMRHFLGFAQRDQLPDDAVLPRE